MAPKARLAPKQQSPSPLTSAAALAAGSLGGAGKTAPSAGPSEIGKAKSTSSPSAGPSEASRAKAKPAPSPSASSTSLLLAAGARIGSSSGGTASAGSVAAAATTEPASTKRLDSASAPLDIGVLDDLLKPPPAAPDADRVAASDPPAAQPKMEDVSPTAPRVGRAAASSAPAAEPKAAELPDVVVVDTENHRVLLFTAGASEGVVVAGGNGEGDSLNQLCTPCDVVVDPSNGGFIITDAANDRVVYWARGAREGKIVAGGNGCGAGLDQLDCPSGIALASDGALVIGDCSNHRVVSWSRGASCGKLLAGRTKVAGDGLDQLSSPNGVALGRDDSLFVADTDNNRVMCFRRGATEGEVVAGGRGEGDDPSQVGFPTGVTATRLGAVLVSERYRQANVYRVTRWKRGDSAGTPVAHGSLDDINMPWGIAETSDGGFFLVDSGHHRVVHWAPGATEGRLVAGGRRGKGLDQMKNPCGIAIA